jgi:hypothetical protein
MADNKINWPDNVNVNGIMTFPTYTEANIEQLKAWRAEKGKPKPRYDDRLGFGLFITEKEYNKVRENLLEVYIPFAKTLQKVTNGEKGVDPKLLAKLEALVKNEDYTEKNLPLRELSEKDLENIEKNGFKNIHAKLKVLGPQNGPIKQRALFREEDETTSSVVGLNTVRHLLGEQTDHERLWWGAGWPFKTGVRFNAFYADPRLGISGYVTTAYLLANQELREFGNTGDASIVADGDDWEED